MDAVHATLDCVSFWEIPLMPVVSRYGRQRAAAGAWSMRPCVRVGQSLCDGNVLSHLICMQRICILFISFNVTSTDEPCTSHSLVVRLTLSRAVFATSSS